MPWCPKCGAEYREGFTECSECRVALTNIEPCKADTPEEPEALILPAGMEKPIAVYTTANHMEAELICEVLGEEDIVTLTRPAVLFEQLRAYGGSSTRDGVDVLVDASQTARARDIIDEVKSGLEAQAIDEEELARLAEEQALDEPEQPMEDNAAFKVLPAVIGVIVLALVLLYFVAGR